MVSKDVPRKKQTINVLERRDGNNYIKTLKRDNYSCKKCNSIMDIFVHHKDKNNKNNNIDNLVCLCRICHAREHFSKIRFNKPTNEIINELRSKNFTYQKIGEYLGISRQRVHQIMFSYKRKP